MYGKNRKNRTCAPSFISGYGRRVLCCEGRGKRERADDRKSEQKEGRSQWTDAIGLFSAHNQLQPISLESMEKVRKIAPRF